MTQLICVYNNFTSFYIQNDAHVQKRNVTIVYDLL